MVVKNFAELKNVHLGKDIYIVASGKSCDFIDPSFFDNKVTIGINQVYKKFKTQYLLRKEIMSDEIINNTLNIVHIISTGSTGQDNRENYDNVIKKYKNSDTLIYHFDHNKNLLKNITFPTKDEDKLIVSFSTITSGIHAAAFMGAKNIIIVGHDCGCLDGHPNFEGYHTSQSMAQKNVQGYKGWLKQIEAQTLQTKEYLKKNYNVNIYSLNPFVNFGLEGHTYTR